MRRLQRTRRGIAALAAALTVVWVLGGAPIWPPFL
jgi:hypothetical protein